jgi:hypothetical protein
MARGRNEKLIELGAKGFCSRFATHRRIAIAISPMILAAAARAASDSWSDSGGGS